MATKKKAAKKETVAKTNVPTKSEFDDLTIEQLSELLVDCKSDSRRLKILDAIRNESRRDASKLRENIKKIKEGTLEDRVELRELKEKLIEAKKDLSSNVKEFSVALKKPPVEDFGTFNTISGDMIVLLETYKNTIEAYRSKAAEVNKKINEGIES